MSSFLSLPAWVPWWVPMVLLVPLALWGLAFLFMPFSVLGVKTRLEVIEARLDEIQEEIRQLALRLPAGQREMDFEEVYAPIQQPPPPPRREPQVATRPPIPPAAREPSRGPIERDPPRMGAGSGREIPRPTLEREPPRALVQRVVPRPPMVGGLDDVGDDDAVYERPAPPPNARPFRREEPRMAPPQRTEPRLDPRR